MPSEAREGFGFSGAVVIDSCKLSWGCWELNPDPILYRSRNYSRHVSSLRHEAFDLTSRREEVTEPGPKHISDPLPKSSH